MKETRRTEFVEVTSLSPDKLSVGSFGASNVGKTRFIATMPDNHGEGFIGCIPLNRKTRRTLEREAIVNSKRILFPKQDFIRLAKPMELALMSVDATRAFYKEHLTNIRNALFTLVERKDVVSIAIDSGTQLSEDTLFSEYGRTEKILQRDRGAYNQDMKEILDVCQDKHFVITHESTGVYVNDKQVPGKSTWKGYGRLDFNVNIIVEHTFKSTPNVTVDKNDLEFGLHVRLCQDRPDLIGDKILENDDITFQMLALTIYPDSDVSDWE